MSVPFETFKAPVVIKYWKRSGHFSDSLNAYSVPDAFILDVPIGSMIPKNFKLKKNNPGVSMIPQNAFNI